MIRNQYFSLVLVHRADAMGIVYSLVFFCATLESAVVPYIQKPVHVSWWAVASASTGCCAWLCLRGRMPETQHLVVGFVHGIDANDNGKDDDEEEVDDYGREANDSTDAEKTALLGPS